MNKLVTEAHELLKNGGFEYAFCGGQALDLFLGYESRVHGDIDICAFCNILYIFEWSIRIHTKSEPHVRRHKKDCVSACCLSLSCHLD